MFHIVPGMASNGPPNGFPAKLSIGADSATW
jgi:hypothetical protein